MSKFRYRLIALLLIPTLIIDPRVVSAWTVSTASHRTPSACEAFSPEAFAFSGCAVFIGPHRSSISGVIHLASLVATKPEELLHSAGIQLARPTVPTHPVRRRPGRRAAENVDMPANTFPASITGRPIELLRERVHWVANIVGMALDMPDEIIRDVVLKTRVEFFQSAAQSSSGNGAIHIHHAGDIFESRAAFGLTMTLAAEMGHRFHQVVMANAGLNPVIPDEIAEVFENVACLAVAFAISPEYGRREIQLLRRDARDGRDLLKALRHQHIRIEDFHGGHYRQSYEVLEEIGRSLVRKKGHMTSDNLYAILRRIARDFFCAEPVGFSAYAASHLLAAALTRDLIDRRLRGDWRAAAAVVGHALLAGRISHNTYEGFRHDLFWLAEMEMPRSRNSVGGSPFTALLQNAVLRATAYPILLPIQRSPNSQSHAENASADEMAERLAMEVTSFIFPGAFVGKGVIHELAAHPAAALIHDRRPRTNNPRLAQTDPHWPAGSNQPTTPLAGPDDQTLDTFRFEPRVAVVPGGMDIRIFDYFPNLEKAYYLNVRPFRVPFQIASLRYMKFSFRKPLEGQQAYDRMMEDYLAESPESYITSATQNNIAHNPAHSQIGFEPFILADLERSGNTHIRVEAVVETIDDPITWRIHFQNPAGAEREIIYSETNVFSGHLPQSLRDDISQQRIGLLFCKAFDPEYVERGKTLAPDLLSLPPGALVARDDFPLDSAFGTPHFLPLAWLKGLTRVGVLGGQGTFLGDTGHFGRMVVDRVPDGQDLEQLSGTPLEQLERRIDREKARLTALLRHILEPLQEGQRTVSQVQALLNPHEGTLFELIRGLRRLFLDYAVLINDEIAYVALRRTDTPDCGLCYEVDECLEAALNAMGLQGHHRYKEVFSGVHRYRLLDDIAVDFTLGQFDPAWIGHIVVEEAAAFSQRIDLAIHEEQPAHWRGSPRRAQVLAQFRRLRKQVVLSQAA